MLQTVDLDFLVQQFSFRFKTLNYVFVSFLAVVSFHPQVHWYQTSDSVTVTLKLMNPESQRCDFYPDRVVYRSVRSRPPMIARSLYITSKIQWSFVSRALYTGGSGYMFSMASLCMN